MYHISWLALLTVGSQAATGPHTFDIRQSLQLLDPSVDQNSNNYYLGYRGNDYTTRWAKYFNDTQVSLNEEFLTGLAQSPAPSTLGLPFERAGEALDKPGYLPLENGYTILPDGKMFLAIRSDVPADFTGEMYDFWFSWHINDTTKYKLWNPSAHQYAAVNNRDIVDAARKPSYRARYYNLTSFVDEYIGDTAYKISLGFFDPRLMGFSPDNATVGVETIVTAFVRIFNYADQDPAASAKRGFQALDVILAHQVRRKPDGSGKEIRSRFWFGAGLVNLMRLIMDPYDLGHDLSVHCATEMTHLGTLLPALFEEFKNDVPVNAR